MIPIPKLFHLVSFSRHHLKTIIARGYILETGRFWSREKLYRKAITTPFKKNYKVKVKEAFQDSKNHQSLLSTRDNDF